MSLRLSSMHGVTPLLQQLAASLSLLLLFPAGAAAQSSEAASRVAGIQAAGAVTGIVTSDRGAAIEGAIVTLEPLRLSEQTDQNGAFAFRDVPAGTYSVVVHVGSLEARDPEVRVLAGQTTTLEKVAPRDFRVSMTETVSAASRVLEQRVEAPAAVSVIDERTIALEGGTGQIPSLLLATPGAEYAQSGVYNIEFNSRGFNGTLSRRVQVLLDGRDLAAPENKNQEWISVGFLASELESIEFVRGPAAALYGANSINGIIAMTTRSPRGSPGGRARVTVGELGTFIGDARWAGSFGREWYGRFVANHTRSGSFARSRTQSAEYDGVPLELFPALVDVTATSADVRFDKYLARGPLLVLEGGLSRSDGGTYLSQGGRIGILDSTRSWSRVNLNTSHWIAHAYVNTRHADQQALFAPVRYPTASLQFKADVQGTRALAGGRGEVVAGGSHRTEHVTSADSEGVQTLYGHAVTSRDVALFGQLDYRLTARLKAVGALRWDESTLHTTQLSPKLALVYVPRPGHGLHVTFKRGFQVGNYTELFLRSPLAPPLDLSAIDAALAPLTGGVPLGFDAVPVNAFGNANLDVEKVRSVEVGYVGSIGSRLRLSVDLYRNSMRDFISPLTPGINPAFAPYQAPAAVPAEVRDVVAQGLNAALPGLTNLPDGRPQIVYSNGNVGLVTSRGVEIEGTFRPRPNWLVETTYTWFDFTIGAAPPSLEPAPNAPKHRATVGLTYTASRVAASFHHRWVDGFTWASGLFVGPVVSYHVSDLHAAYDLTPRWKLGANISNVFDRAHYEMFGGDVLRRRALGHMTVFW